MRYDKLVPPGSFIHEYMAACDALETPLAYDFWTAMWVIGTCVGRDVYVPRPHSPIHLNWYVLLVSESGVTRKSTAVRMARDIVSSVLGPSYLMEGRTTPEHLLETLVKQPRTAVAVSELVNFLGRASYVIELPAMLTDFYDCPKQRSWGTVTQGRRIIENAFVTFLSASTPSWLISAVNPTVVEGGFTSRCMFVHAEKPKQRVPWPVDGGEIAEAVPLLRETIKEAQRVGHIELMPAAMRKFELWYRRRDIVTNDAFLSSFLSREDAHVLRVAACLCINDGTMAISPKHIEAGTKVINAVKGGALAIFHGQGSSTKMAQAVDKIIGQLIEAGAPGVAHTPLFVSVRHLIKSDDFRLVMEYMHELGIVRKLETIHRVRGRPGVRYVRTDETTRKEKVKSLSELLR